ncbi:MAG: FapA family protein [Lachnospiraceae bacterium]|nr:FapA family protein [Lachnospiraceae bacterium]
MKRNGYFQLQMSDRGTFVRLFPPTEGGEPIRTDEIRQYLAMKNFTPDPVQLNKALMDLSEPTDFKLDDKKTFAVMEMFVLQIAENKMSATARFYPPSSAGTSLHKEDIINDLKHKGIKAGIDEAEIDRFLKEKHYCSDYVLAKGKAPVQGQDASIEYFFNTNPNTKPALNDDGTVDFFNLNVISKCEVGQELARLHPEVPGEAGYNVLGERVAPRDVIKMRLRYGRNITLSEDGLSISSNVNGHVSLTEDLVTVTDVYEVTDVDTATGNIEYSGNVQVLGNVKAGFAVQADGNIEVRGVVEGALLQAGGDIIIMRGMNGMGRGKLIADGNIVSKFIENSDVRAGGYVHSEAIMHSTITAKGNVEVTGKKGFITGGCVHSMGTVSAKTIGSTMGAKTDIEVGIDPTIKERVNHLMQSTADIRKQLQQIEPVLITFTQKLQKGNQLTTDQQMYFNQLKTVYQKLKPQQKEEEAELERLITEMETMTTDAIVRVQDFAYPGTTIKISDVSLNISSNIQHCRFVKEGADIRIKSY